MRAIGLFSCLLLVGCAGGPDVETWQGSDRSAAENAVVVAGADGAVPVLVDAAPSVFAGPGANDEIAALAGRGAAGTRARFVPAATRPAPPTPHLLLRFEDVAAFSPAQLCLDEPTVSSPSFAVPPRMTAVLCRGDVPLASANGTASDGGRDAAERLVIDTVGRLFPENTSYGGYGARVGVGIGSGGDFGLGASLGF